MRSGVRLPLGPLPGRSREKRQEHGCRRGSRVRLAPERVRERRDGRSSSIGVEARERAFGMWDERKRDRMFWGAAVVAVGLFIWVYSHAASGEGDFADAPPSLAPSAAIQAVSPSPGAQVPSLSPSSATPSPSPASSVILPVTFGREIAAQPPIPSPSDSAPSTSTSPRPAPKPRPSTRPPHSPSPSPSPSP